MSNIAKVIYQILMAALSRSALDAIGFVRAPAGHVEVPDYIRYSVLETWDGTSLNKFLYHRELSLSLLSGIVLYCFWEDCEQI